MGKEIRNLEIVRSQRICQVAKSTRNFLQHLGAQHDVPRNKRNPAHFRYCLVSIRYLVAFEAADFGDALSPELKEQEEQVRQNQAG